MANLLGWATHTDCDLDLQQREPKGKMGYGGGVNMRQKKTARSRGRGTRGAKGEMYRGRTHRVGKFNLDLLSLSTEGGTVESPTLSQTVT